MGQEFSKGYVSDCSSPNVLEFLDEDLGSNRPSQEELQNLVQHGPNSTCIVFDWDDTLLCSTAINTHQWQPSQLKELEVAVKSILLTSMSIAETCIVTNGNATWVMDSASRFLPGLLPTLQRLTVVSARALFESSYPGDPYMWKKAAFSHLFVKERVVPQGKTGMNMVALGDQMPEIEAAQNVGKLIGGTSAIKTLKFKEAPTVSELLGQLARAEKELAELVKEPLSMNRGLVRRSLPSHLDYLVAQAPGWRLSERDEEWSLSKSLKDFWPLFS